MQGEEAYPPCRVDGVLMRMVSAMRDFVWNVMYRDDPVKYDQNDENQNKERDIVEHGFRARRDG